MELNKIHEDKRGIIFSVTGAPLTSPEVSFLTCNAGYSRGGCIHRKNSEHLCVIEGVMTYVYGEDQHHCILKPGQSITIPPNTPHFMLALTDCVFIEWGCEIDEKAEKHEEFRKIVNEINSLHK